LLNEKEDFDCCNNVDGVLCDDGHIKEITIEVKNPTLPESFGKMDFLDTLIISDAELKGTIPNDIGNLKNLRRLYLNNNKLEGTIPETIGQLVKLEDLVLGSNKLEGPIPNIFGKLVNLVELNLSNNNFSGELPTAELEKIETLGRIELQENKNLYGRAPFSSKFYQCDYNGTKLCKADKKTLDICNYPEENYECVTCKDEKLSTLKDDICTCNEGYTGPAYIECTKADSNNNGSNNNQGNDNKSESGALATLSSMNILYFIILSIFGMLYI